MIWPRSWDQEPSEYVGASSRYLIAVTVSQPELSALGTDRGNTTV